MKEHKLDITVIIPIHILNDETKELTKVAIGSVSNQRDVKIKHTMIVGPATVTADEYWNQYDNIILTTNDGNTDYWSQVNFAVGQVETKYFSVLEIDDEYSNIYFRNVKQYIESYPEVSAFLPVMVYIENGQMIQFVNEAVWAQGFGEKLGYLDMSSLLQYSNFNFIGGIFNKEAFEEVGGLKSDLKMYSDYEFLLRFVNNDFATMVIPKLGYMHSIGRKDSILVNYNNPELGITPEEVRFLQGAAKQEYFFNPNIISRTVKYSGASA